MRSTLRASTIAAAILAYVLMPMSASAQTSGFLYALVTDSNAQNTVAGFAVDASGNFTALQGFPILTGGNGRANAYSALSLAYDAVNRRLYAVNTGSSTVSAWTVNTATGALTSMPFSPLALPSNLSPVWSCVLTNPSGSVLVIGDGNVNRVASYVITASSATPAAGSPFSTGASLTSSCAFSQDGAYYYSGGGNGNLFAGHSVNQISGVLTPLPGSPYDSGFSGPHGYQTDSSGRLFAATAPPPGGGLVFTTSGGVPTGVVGNPFASKQCCVSHGLLHSAGFYLTSAESSFAMGYVGVARISGSGPATTLTAVPGSPFDTGAIFSLASVLDNTNDLVITANVTSRNATVFKFDQATGALTRLRVTPVDSFGSSGQVTGLVLAAVCSASPSITTQPASQAIPSGAKVILFVIDSECAPSHQWYQGTTGNTLNPIGGATSSSHTTAALISNTKYWVRVSDGNGSAIDSNTATVTVNFTDSTVTAASTTVKSVHVTELRARIDAQRTRFGLNAFSWTDSPIATASTIVKQTHFAEMRSALQAAYVAAGFTPPTYTDPTLTAGTSPINAVDLTELRTAVTNLEGM